MAEEQKRTIPRNELEYNLILTDTLWGSAQISEELKDKLKKEYGYYDYKRDDKGNLIKDKEGKPIQILYVKEEALWGLLGFYTRDLRLGNLSVWTGELATCTYYLNLANDFLHSKMPEPFLICLSRVATILELSQSKGGFFRRRSNTLTQEHFNAELEPKKNSLFGKGKED